jgi:hypothetical protein
MKARLFSLVSLCLLLAFGTGVGADDQSHRRLEATIRFLADDLLEGRGTPGRGLDLAALYLASELRAAGWEPGDGDDYFQTYVLRDFSPQRARYKISLHGVPLDRQDFIFLPIGLDPALTPLRYDLVFVGHGIAAPERGVDDYASVDIRGKAVVALLGAPWELDPKAVHAYDRAVGKSAQVTVRNGACLIYVSEEFAAPAGRSVSAEVPFFREMSHVPLSYLPEFQGSPTIALSPILVITPSVFDRTLAGTAGGTYAEWKARLADHAPEARALNATLEVTIEVEPRESPASNVVAMLPGSDPALQDEWVVLTAHYDHLGFREVGAGQDGIWNGADDNASGTAAVLEIARRLAAGEPVKRSVLVLFTSGEDRGLLGSAHYSLHPLVPYDRVVVDINVDQVGRSTGTVQGIAPGSDDLFAKAVEIGRRHGVTVQPDQQPTWRIVYFLDSYHFARFGTPFIEFFTGLHKDYHQPSDEAQFIRYEELDRIFEAMYELADYYAQGGKKPTFQRPKWFLTAGQ